MSKTLHQESFACCVLWILLPLCALSAARTWRRHGRSCYTLVSAGECLGVYRCRHFCKNISAYLTEIETTEELEFLYNLTENSDQKEYWVGMEYVDGVYQWMESGLPVGGDLWPPGEPHHEGVENSCTRIRWKHGYDGGRLDVRLFKFEQCLDDYKDMRLTFTTYTTRQTNFHRPPYGDRPRLAARILGR